MRLSVAGEYRPETMAISSPERIASTMKKPSEMLNLLSSNPSGPK